MYEKDVIFHLYVKMTKYGKVNKLFSRIDSKIIST